MLEVLIKSLSVKSAAIEPHIAATIRKGLSGQEFAGYMKGLTKLESDYIYCKFLLDEDSCSKGVRSSYRSYLYRQPDFIQWAFAKQHKEVNTRVAEIINTRSRHIPILLSLAWEGSISSTLCLTCNGEASVEIEDKIIKCDACKGSGVRGSALSAEHKSLRLHCSTSQYYADWHKPLQQYFEKPLRQVEMSAIGQMAENWSQQRE